MSPLKLSEVVTPGWYINIAVDSVSSNLLFDIRYRAMDLSVYEFDRDGVWRSTTGHGVTLEQPDYFKEDGDLFVGPLTFPGGMDA